MTVRMVKDFPSGDREDFYGLGLSPGMKSRLAEQMAEDPRRGTAGTK